MTNDNVENQELEPSEKALIEAFKQNWLHFRHIENERLQFTYVYSILIIAALTLLTSSSLNKFQVTNSYSLFLVGFVVLLSFHGYLLILRANRVLSKYMEKIGKIVYDLNLTNHVALPSERGGGKQSGYDIYLRCCILLC